jgi:hypothetical protein
MGQDFLGQGGGTADCSTIATIATQARANFQIRGSMNKPLNTTKRPFWLKID